MVYIDLALIKPGINAYDVKFAREKWSDALAKARKTNVADDWSESDRLEKQYMEICHRHLEHRS